MTTEPLALIPRLVTAVYAAGEGQVLAALEQPARLVDTRGSRDGPVQPGADRCFDIAGRGGIPANAAGVILNVTALGYTDNGWLTVYPAGQPLGKTSTVNFDSSEAAIANGTIARPGNSGQVCVSAAMSVAHVLLDATGYLPSSASSFVQLLSSPSRLVDTRALGGGPVQQGANRCFGIAGRGGIPADATGVLLNVTAVDQTGIGWLTVYPSGQPPPSTSTLNFDLGQYAIANNALVKLGSGQVCVYAGESSADAILDVVGYLTAAGPASVPLLANPARLVDTRALNGGPVQPDVDQCFSIAGQGGIPADAASVLLNVTAVGQTGTGWLTVYPAGQPLPGTSTLNFDANHSAIANGAIVPLGPGGLCAQTGGMAAQLILDSTGYIPTPGFGSVSGLVTRSGKTAGVPGVSIAVYSDNPSSDTDPPQAAGHTDASGAYLFTNLPNGGYLLVASRLLEAASEHVAIAGGSTQQDLQLTSSFPATCVPGVNCPLTVEYDGRVVDANGQPVSGATVWHGKTDCRTTTGANGSYKLIVPLALVQQSEAPRTVIAGRLGNRWGVIVDEGAPSSVPDLKLDRTSAPPSPAGLACTTNAVERPPALILVLTPIPAR